MDDETIVGALKRQVSKFRDDRDWLKDDTPRSLAISISIEAAELLEHFQWKSDDQIHKSLLSPTTRNEISNELADVMIYCLGFSDVLGIDLSEAIQRKLVINGEKYPVTKPDLSA